MDKLWESKDLYINLFQLEGTKLPTSQKGDLAMKLNEFNSFCKSFPFATYVVQWRGSHVWKVGSKVFAIGRWDDKKNSGITFKVSKITFECLKHELGIRPAPYLATRGMNWLQCYNEDSISRNDLRSHLTRSYNIVFDSLTKKIQRELNVNI